MEAAEYLECERRQIHVMCEKGRAITQITLDDDYNLAEYKPDILKIIEDKGQVRMEEVKVEVCPVAHLDSYFLLHQPRLEYARRLEIFIILKYIQSIS